MSILFTSVAVAGLLAIVCGSVIPEQNPTKTTAEESPHTSMENQVEGAQKSPSPQTPMENNGEGVQKSPTETYVEETHVEAVLQTQTETQEEDLSQSPPVEKCLKNAGAKAGRKFAYELYSQALAETDSNKNIFLAPTTVQSALAMVYAGAKGDTKAQIWKGLMFQNETTEAELPCLLASFGGGSKKQIKPEENPLVLRTAKRLFGEEAFRFNKDFVKRTASYGAGMEEVKFAQNPDESREYINSWVANVTQDKIQDLFSEDDITPDTVLAITSAIYFKGLWKTEFDAKRTREQEFHVDEATTVKTKFMGQTSQYRVTYSTRLKAQLLELPYKSDADGKYNASMIIVWPNNFRDSAMTTLEKRLTEGNVRSAMRQLFNARKRTVEIALPKFKMSGDYDLDGMLKSMGMKNMFNPYLADLSGMIDPETGGSSGNLYVGAAVHKTFIEVDEKGTEASGATGISIWARSSPQQFICDSPFITIIYERNTRSILFIGKVNDPTAE